jgi:aspartyl-tRNA(Asn)/glutamyl-tRNA(Gln) amidotransferase subunit B
MIEARRRLSSIDLNRAGTGLMEIVSKPDMRYAMRLHFDKQSTYAATPPLRSPEEASEYVRTLRAVLRSVAASDGNMEQASTP